MIACPEHKVRKSIQITKGDKIVGTNYFCPKVGCHWEADVSKTGVIQRRR